ncbi:MAG: NHL repeat-containing protein [Candidatus Tumulicola sp.]
MTLRLYFVSSVVTLLALGACAPIQASRATDALDVVPTSATPAGDSLYVANESSVSVYSLQTGALLRVVPNGGPRALAFDAKGNLYVANDRANTVTVYASGKTSVLRVITSGLDVPNALAFDRSGSLYVSNNHNDTVTVYAAGSSKILRTIDQGVHGPHDVIFNRLGDLFVGNNGSSHITVYPPGRNNVIRTDITHNGPLALAFNHAQDLFCVNNFNVTVYKPGRTEPTRTISDGISLPSTLSFDGTGNLYVANWGGNMFRSFVSIYAPGESSPTRQISKGIGYPLSLVFDASGNLYVANSAYDTVTEYAPAGSKPARTISDHVSRPSALAIGP